MNDLFAELFESETETKPWRVIVYRGQRPMACWYAASTGDGETLAASYIRGYCENESERLMGYAKPEDYRFEITPAVQVEDVA